MYKIIIPTITSPLPRTPRIIGIVCDEAPDLFGSFELSVVLLELSVLLELFALLERVFLASSILCLVLICTMRIFFDNRL